MSRDDLSFENITFGPFIDSDYIKGVNPTQWEKIRELGDTQNSQERIENLLRVDQAVVISEDDFNQDNGIIQYALDEFKTVKLKDGTTSAGKRILIDGQQRVTALMAALLGQKVINKN